jgi:Smg protein
MKERVVEILVYLMHEIQDDRQLADVDLAELRNRGYTAGEISTAFSWLQDTMQAGEAGRRRTGHPGSGSRRLLHEAERSALSPAAQGFLIDLREVGLLTDADLETVIERAMVSGYERLGVEDLHSIVATVLFSRGAAHDGRVISSGSDTVH